LVAGAGWPWPLAALAGGAAAIVLAVVIGYPCLRLKGPYFAIAMLGLNEVLRALVSYFEGLTGGGNGLSLPTLDASVPIYYVMGVLAVAVTAMAWLIVTSRFGLRLMTIREDEVAGAVVVVAFGLLVVVLLVLSLPWPLIQDAPVMHYIAWRIGEGDVPYRDLYDINQPGVYVLHLALLRTLGAGDAAWRAFDLAWLAATAGAVALLAARWGAVAAAGAALAFAAYHLA